MHKNMKTLYESILADIDDTINRGENDIEQVYYNEMLSINKYADSTYARYIPRPRNR
jgi:hypothetical protein